MLLDAVRKLIEWRDFDAPWRYRDFDRDREIDGLLADIEALGELRSCGKPDDWLTKALDEFDRFVYEMNRLEAVRGGRDYDALEAELLKLLSRRQNIWTWKGYGPLYGARNGEPITREDVLDRRERVRQRLEQFRDAAGAQLAPMLRDEMWPVVGALQRTQAARRPTGFHGPVADGARPGARQSGGARRTAESLHPHFHR